MAGKGLTEDRFLDGRLVVTQPARGYRAGVDAVLLAAAVDAVAGQSVLDLGCGTGVATLCLGARVPGLTLVGLEVQSDYAALARANAAYNGLALEVIEGDLTAMPASLKQRRFDHVIANPPYFIAKTRTATRDAGRETAHAGVASLNAWVDAGSRRLVPGGKLAMIQRANRLPDLLRACDNRLGDLDLLPLQPRVGQPAHLVLLRARKGGRGPCVLRAPIPLHEGSRHETDRDSFTESIRAVLRGGSKLI